MSEKGIQDLMENVTERIKATVDTDAVVGKPIVTPDGVTIIPISQLSYGFGSGGTDIPNKQSQSAFGGGGGAGVSVIPVGFLVVSNGEVRMLQIEPFNGAIGRAIESAPVIIDKVAAKIKEFSASKKGNKEKTEEDNKE